MSPCLPTPALSFKKNNNVSFPDPDSVVNIGTGLDLSIGDGRTGYVDDCDRFPGNAISFGFGSPQHCWRSYDDA
jgi:hypothetical protein